MLRERYLHLVRIAMVSTPFVAVPPLCYGGTELIVAELCVGLVELGHEVTLFATGDSHLGVPTESLFETAEWPPCPYVELAHAAWAIGETAARPDRFDVIHAHVAAAVALGAFAPQPLVYTLHHGLDERLQRFYAAAALRKGAYFPVAISARQGAVLGDGSSIDVVHHGVDAGRYPIGKGGSGVAFLGRLSREKGPADAIAAAQLVGVPIRIAGKPHWDDVEYFKSDIEGRLGQPGVDYLGEVDHAKKCELLGGAAALLCPVAWEEPFGLAAIESMLCGTPVVAFARGSMPEIIESGVTGFLAADVPDMARLVREGIPKIDRRRCRERAALRWGRQRMVRDYLAVYERAIAATSREWRTGAHSNGDDARSHP